MVIYLGCTVHIKIFIQQSKIKIIVCTHLETGKKTSQEPLFFSMFPMIEQINFIFVNNVCILQSSKWKLEFTGPNQFLEFIYIYIYLNKNWKIYWSEQSFTGLGSKDRCSSWGLNYLDVRTWLLFSGRYLVLGYGWHLQ